MPRTIRIGGSLVITLMAYFVYAQVVVRLIEPDVSPSDEAAVSEAQLAEARNAISRRVAELADLFPPDAWELQNPKILESEQFKLLLRDYKNQGDGTVRISPCTMIFLPEEEGTGTSAAHAGAVVLQAPQGALLRFDRPFDLRRANIGRLESGQLTGPITIRSDGRKPGPDDDLLIMARDVQMNEHMVWTPHSVDFRMGPNHGRGRQMRIQLLPGQSDSTSNSACGPNIAGIESFELMTLERLHLQFDETADPASAGNRAARGPTGAGQRLVPRFDGDANLPVEVSCRGPFRLDLTGQVATFEDRVDVLRLRPNGPSDQLSCELLSIHFVRASEEANQARPTSDDNNEPDDDRGPADLRPQRIEARGAPVVVRVPVDQVEARGRRLEYNLETGRILLEGEGQGDVFLTQGPNRIQARSLQYEPDPQGRLGPLIAEGPGWIRAQAPDDPRQQLDAEWQEQLRIRRYEQSQVISLTGAAGLKFHALGALAADEIHFWLIESQPGEPQYELQPDRMLAMRQVKLESEQISGAVDRLEVWFESDPDAPGGRWKAEDAGRVLQGRLNPRPDDRSTNAVPPARRARDGLRLTDYRTATAGGNGRLPQPDPRGRPPAGPNASSRAEGPVPITALPAASQTVPSSPRYATQAPASPPPSPGSTVPATGGPANTQLAPGQHFAVTGALLRAQVLVSDTTTELSELMIEGNVRLRETRTEQSDELPMIIEGDKLHVVDASQPHAAVTVTGRPAHFEARGLGLTGSNINLNRGTNRLWIDGPGQMDLPMTHDFEGRPIRNAGPLRVHWQDRMSFDGHAVRFEGSIVAAAQNQRLETETLETVFTEPIHFSQPQPRAQARPDLHQIRCRGGVFLASRAEDEQGQLSFERVEVDDLVINLVTGALNAGGPGRVTTVRRGSADLIQLRDAAQSDSEPEDDAAQTVDGKGLMFLRVTFQNSITGNVHRREMTFHDQVRTTYGPVASWDAVLPADDPDALGPRGVLLSCNRLSVTEMVTPLKNVRAVELEASGNTLIEGSSFTARAGRVTFAEAKDLLVLEGNGRTDAELFRQQYPGGPMSKAAAQKILYWPSSNRLKVDGARSLELSQFGQP